MACAKPMKAYRAPDGGPLSFSRPIAGEAGQDYTGHTIPCGYCEGCREEQARQTAVRIVHEAQYHPHSSFLTLTYNDKHLPEFGSLSSETPKTREAREREDRYAWQRPEDRDHVSKFWKRMRKHLGNLRHYTVGEYGDKSKRAHYHACLFGHDFAEDRIIYKTTPHLLWISPTLTRIWGMGDATIGTLNFQTARYTASYVLKKMRSKQKYVRVDQETGELLELVQPRAYMSRNLAKQWWADNRHYVSAHDAVIIDGKPQKPPKAYDRWLGERNELALEMIKDQRTMHVADSREEPDARARALNARARTERKNKSI